MGDRLTWVAPKRSAFLASTAHAARAYSSVALCGRQLAGLQLRRAEAADTRCRKCEARA